MKLYINSTSAAVGASLCNGSDWRCCAARFVTLARFVSHTHKHTCTYTYPFKVTKRVKFDALAAGFISGISVVTKRSVVTKGDNVPW